MPHQARLRLGGVPATHGPDGREVKALRRTLTLKGGTGQVRLPLAWDDAPGRWQVTVHDLATGLKQTIAYKLP